MDDYTRRTIGRLLDRGIPVPCIAQAMGRSEDSIKAFIKRRGEMRNEAARGAIRRLVTVKDPEAYLRSKGVWYGDEMSMVRSA